MKSIFFIFEFGVPNYREFILNHFCSNQKYQINCVSANDKFNYHNPRYNIKIAKELISKGENKIYIFPPLKLLRSDFIITTFNLRRPHTWLYVLFFPWKKWVFWGQGVWKGQGTVVNLLRKLLLKISSGYIVYTEEGKRNLIEFGYPEERISVAINTLAVANSSECKGGEYLLYVGRVQERKRIEWIFPYLKELNINLRVVGDGEYKKKLISLVHKYDIEANVEFFPATFDDEEIKSHFSGAICYITPGHVGLGVVHAFAYGCPIFTVKTMEHAPEIAYCNKDNSYLASGYDDVQQVLLDISNDASKLKRKKRKALLFYQQNLSPNNVIAAFDKQISGKYR
jgi:glycosyltransferase involved in cell wall biosynthesis